MATTVNYNLLVNRGQTWVLNLQGYSDANNTVPIDFTSGYTFDMQVRSQPGAADLLVEMSDGNGRVVFGVGTIVVTLSADDTAPLAPGTYFYDAILINAGVKQRLMEGFFEVRDGVTV